MSVAIIVNMWFCLHWLYCNMYLQTACLFRGTFQTLSKNLDNDQEHRRMKRCEKWLSCVEVFGLCSIGLLTLVYVVVGLSVEGKNYAILALDPTFCLVWTIALSFMALTSAYHLDKNTKSIKRIGIRTN